MPVRRLDEEGLRALRNALVDPVVLARYRAKITTVPGSECLWWTGAVAGRSERGRTDGGGHGRFWFAPGRVIIAHRFAFAVMHGVEALDAAALWAIAATTRCASGSPTITSWSPARRRTGVSGRSAAACPISPLADPRGPRRCARELRDMARDDPQLVAADLVRLRQLLGEQLTLW